MARQIHCRSLHHHLSPTRAFAENKVLRSVRRLRAEQFHNGSGLWAEGVAAATGIVLRCLGSHEGSNYVIVPSTVRER